MAFPFGFLVFGFATPSFQCAIENTTCGTDACCDNCTSYKFVNPPFTSTVTEVGLDQKVYVKTETLNLNNKYMLANV